MSKSRNWTGTANDRYGEIESISLCTATVGSRCEAAVDIPQKQAFTQLGGKLLFRHGPAEIFA